MAARFARVAFLLLVLPLLTPSMALADAQLIADLRECLERTDASRGQDPEWRASHCPSDEEARQKLEDLLQEQQEAVVQTVEKAKKKARSAAGSASVSAESSEGSGSGGDTSTSNRNGGRATKRSRPGSQSAATSTPASSTSITEAGLFTGDPSNPCAAISSLRSIVATAFDGLELPSMGLSDLVLPTVSSSLAYSALDQMAGICRNLLGSLQVGLPLFSQPAQQQQVVPLLEVDKTAQTLGGNTNPDPGEDFESGDIFFYNIKVSVTEAAANNVLLTDDWPDDLTFLGATPSQGSCTQTLTSGNFTCNLGTIGAGQSASIVAIARIPDAYCSEQDLIKQPMPKNTAFVTADGNPLTMLDSYVIEVDCSSLHIEKNTVPESVNPLPGDEVLFTIAVGNFPVTHEAVVGRATNVVVTDQLPATLQILSVSPGCTVGAGNLVTCQLGDMEVADDDEYDKQILIRAKVLTAGGCTGIANTAEVSADNEWPAHRYDNDSTARFETQCAPNIVISKTGQRSGNQLTYTLTATNNGTAPAEGVVVTDDLRNALSDVVATPSQGTCSVGAANTVGCNLGTIANGATATVTITARIPADVCGNVANDAAGAASNEPAGERGDNTAQVTNETGDCVLGAGFTRGVVALAVTGLEVWPLLVLGLSLMAAGVLVLRSGRRSRARA